MSAALSYLSKMVSSNRFAPVAAACLGLILFIAIYGTAVVVNPTNVN